MNQLPFGVNINNLINDLRTFSWEASETLLYYAQILRDTDNKSNILKNDDLNDPVTLADLKVNEIIIKRIREKYTNINWGILSEENVKDSYQYCDHNKDWIWVLDPLDGTKDFIQGTGNYAMHLALNFKQKPFLGVVLIPEKDQLWLSVGDKVWCEKKDGSKFYPNLTKNKYLQKMVLVKSKNHRNQTLENLIEKINFKKVVVMGSIGCKIASILSGETDIYISLSLPGQSSPKDWDLAAPESILKAAGGAITNLENKELSYGKTNFEHGGIIIASNNKYNHEKICLEIKAIIESYKIHPFCV